MNAHTPKLAASESSRRSPIAAWVFVPMLTIAALYVGMRWHATLERWLVPSSRDASSAPSDSSAPSAAAANADMKQLWTCGMHPQVIQDHPGDCPICHMKLTPLVTSSAAGAATTGTETGGVVIDPAVVQNMGVRVAAATQGTLTQHVRATATLAEPESARMDINLRVSGWIEKLYANTDGMAVRKGDPLFDLFSPDLRLAIEELIAAQRVGSRETADSMHAIHGTGETLASAARRRLQTLGFSDQQIEHFASLDHAPSVVTFASPIDGIVIEKANLYNGSAIMPGQMVLRLADRSSMWVEVRVPEGILRRIKVGQAASIHIDSLARSLSGEVIFIHPNLDEMTRTALVRVAVPNPDGELRLGMYARVEFDASPTVHATIVPREAVIDTGESQVVFVSLAKGRFEPRQVKLGASGGGGMVEIVSGVSAGEAVVVSGQFLIDSESRLREAIAKFLGQSSGTSAAPDESEDYRTTPGKRADAKAPAELVDKFVAEYLAIAEPFGEEVPNTPAAKLDGLLAAIRSLAEKATGPDAKRLTDAARNAATAMKDQPIAKQRDGLKRLSAAVIAIVDAMPPSDAMSASLFVATCPMAKADWLQRSDELANPYYAEDMKECGGIVRRLGKNAAGAKGDMP